MPRKLLRLRSMLPGRRSASVSPRSLVGRVGAVLSAKWIGELQWRRAGVISSTITASKLLPSRSSPLPMACRAGSIKILGLQPLTANMGSISGSWQPNLRGVAPIERDEGSAQSLKCPRSGPRLAFALAVRLFAGLPGYTRSPLMLLWIKRRVRI